MTETTEAAREPVDVPTPRRWPPPGLERMQGDLGRIAARGAFAGGLLVLPMLFVVAREQGFATLGPLADAWWVTVILASTGLAFTIDILVRTGRLLRRSARAMGHGYDLRTLLQVAADIDRDTGFLLQGARHFVVMEERERHAMVQIRVFSAGCHALAGLWMSVALGVGLLGAARGLLSPTGLWVLTLLPAMALYAFGGVGRLLQDSRVRTARRAYHNQPWAKDLTSAEIEQWKKEHGLWPGSDDTAEYGVGATTAIGPWLRRAAFAVGVVGILVVVPVLTLLPTSIAGPVLSTLATPRLDQLRRRAVRAEAYRPYVVAADPALTPQVAGQLMHDLAHVGVDDQPTPGEKAPSRPVTQAWLPETGPDNPFDLDPFQWGDALLERVAEGTTGAERAYLAQVAAHPSHAEFSRLAEAADIDIASARWEVPFPDGITVATMPIPRFGAFRSGAQAHIGAAAYELIQGRPERAERLISEVISVGFLVGDHGPTLIDNLIGYTLVDVGGRALEDLYAATGQTEELDALLHLRGVADRAASRIPVGLPLGTESWVRSLPEVVLDTASVRGLRWEYFISVTTLTPCLNLHRIVFGPDEEYQQFLVQAHESLVRFPSEEGLYELAREGWLGTIRSDDVTAVGRILSVSMRGGESACGEVIRRIETAQQVF